MEKMNGLSLFSGYGGNDLALSDYVTTIGYCEREKYAQGILLSRMDDGTLPFAPIWDDVTTMDGNQFRGVVDIIEAGFPCQDISVAGKGAGLEGKRSGLFYEVVRVCKEASPLFIFLENVPAIRTRGAIEVAEALAAIGYDCRWHHLSAAEVGANHKRERWFLLAYSRSEGLEGLRISERVQKEKSWSNGSRANLANTKETERRGNWAIKSGKQSRPTDQSWWETEPGMGRVANGVINRPHRIKALGNGVVPLQAKTAFEILMGIRK